jgi:hypothetical protein
MWSWTGDRGQPLRGHQTLPFPQAVTLSNPGLFLPSKDQGELRPFLPIQPPTHAALNNLLTTVSISGELSKEGHEGG